MPDQPISGLTKRELAMILAAVLFAAVLVVELVYYFIGVFFPRDPNDPLSRAGGLKPEQSIHSK